MVEALVRPVVVEVALVLGEDCAGVSFVVDQEPVGALGAVWGSETRCGALTCALHVVLGHG